MIGLIGPSMNSAAGETNASGLGLSPQGQDCGFRHSRRGGYWEGVAHASCGGDDTCTLRAQMSSRWCGI